jgi:hypothetical protein
MALIRITNASLDSPPLCNPAEREHNDEGKLGKLTTYERA